MGDWEVQRTGFAQAAGKYLQIFVDGNAKAIPQKKWKFIDRARRDKLE